jgi:hypothetical protein
LAPLCVFRTDWHDLEGFLLRSTALDRVLHEYAAPEKLSQWRTDHGVSSVADFLAGQAALIGTLLRHSLHETLGLNFRGLSSEHIASPTDLSISPQALVATVSKLSGEAVVDLNTWDQALAHSHGAAVWQLARGHDVVQLLCFALRTAWKKPQVSQLNPESMKRVLRTSYPLPAFRETTLYRLISAWELNQAPWRILEGLAQRA